MRHLKRLIHASLILSLTLSSSVGFAAEAPGISVYVWTNKSGFKSMDGCQVNVRPDSRFRVINYASAPFTYKAETLLDENGKETAKKVPRFSLVKIIGEEVVNGSELIEVVGVQPGSQESGLAVRQDKGYVPAHALETILGYMIQLDDVGIIPKMEQFQLKGSFLQSVIAENGQYVVYTCEGQDYSAFKVLTGKAGDPIVPVGIYWDQTKVVRDIHVVQKDEALRQLAQREKQRLEAIAEAARVAAAKEAQRIAEEARLKAEAEAKAKAAYEAKQAEGAAILTVISANAGVGDRIRAEAKVKAEAEAAAKLAEIKAKQMQAMEEAMDDTSEVIDPNEPEEEEVEASKDENIDGELGFVVCMDKREDSLSIYDEEQIRVLFALPNGTPVKLFQDFEGTTAGPEVKIQVTSSSRVGWAPTARIKPFSQCSSIESDKPAGTTDVQLTADGKYPEVELTACTLQGSPLSVYDENFVQMKPRFYLDSGEKATVIDGTLVDKLPEANGYKYVKVRTESNNIRYVAADYLMQGTCATSSYGDASSVETKSIDGYVMPVTRHTGYSYIREDKRERQDPWFSQFDGYTGFTENGKWKHGWGFYGATRGGRGHAADDMYQPRGITPRPKGYSYNDYGGPFVALHGGTVVKGATKFVGETYYIVVLNDDDTVSRYGEIYKNTVYTDKKVKAGEVLGHIRWVEVNRVPPMLHFENYTPGDSNVRAGNLQGSKKVNGMNTKRSKYLIDRTDFVLKLEHDTFPEYVVEPK